MNLKLSREVKIGIFFILMLFTIFVVLNFIKGQDIFKKSNTYYIVYDDVDGLMPTSHVFMKGLKIGSVEAISFIDKSQQFLVKISIKDTYRLPQHSVAEISSTDIMGNKAIKIILSKETQCMQSGDTLIAGAATGMVATLTEELLPLKNKIDTLVSSLNITVGALNTILNTETQADIIAGIASLRQNLLNLQQLTSLFTKEQHTIKNIVQNTDTFIAELQKSSKNIVKTMEHLSQFTDSLRSADIKTTIANFNAMLQQFNDTKGNMGKFLHDGKLYDNLTNSIAHLDSLIIAIKSNPKKYIKVSVF
jgi:phospholipid/cholesterol/gamma-HCH transport system substrate-binding protein